MDMLMGLPLLMGRIFFPRHPRGLVLVSPQMQLDAPLARFRMRGGYQFEETGRIVQRNR